MLHIPRSQVSVVKNIIYPNINKLDPRYQKQNIATIKKIQNENRLKKSNNSRSEYSLPKHHPKSYNIKPSVSPNRIRIEEEIVYNPIHKAYGKIPK